MYTIDDLKKRISEIWGDEYDYDWSTYVKMTESMRMICHIHGNFPKSMHEHLNKKQGCPYCARENKIKNQPKKLRKRTPDEYFEECEQKFGTKFLYLKDSYRGLGYDISYYCPVHGLKTQNAGSHLSSKYGCPECAKLQNIINNTKTTEQFIEEARKVHGDKYDYSKVVYIDCDTDVWIICPIHGGFWQKPKNHLAGYGCKECGKERTIEALTLTNEEFKYRANKKHNGKYIYIKPYINGDTLMDILCPLHGIFPQTPNHHLQGEGCPICGNNLSKCEDEIAKYCNKILPNKIIQQKNKSVLKKKELDIYIPSYKIAIEYDGLYWHSEKYKKNKNYHLEKTEECENKGIKLIHIFEDEYIEHKDIVLKKLKKLFSVNETTNIEQNNCLIKEIGEKEAKNFIEKNDLYGFEESSIYLAAFYNDSIFFVFSFKNKKNNEWELTRITNNYEYFCDGIEKKTFDYFVEKFDPQIIEYLSDRRWENFTDNNFYTNLGFTFNGYLKPDYTYVNDHDGKRYKKTKLTKKVILEKFKEKYGLINEMTKEEMIKKMKFYKIWDCGLIKYVWNSSNNTNNNTKEHECDDEA